MTRRLFGTDGIRGTANIDPMTPDTALKEAMGVVLVGPLPTPAIAMLTRSLRADIGVVISASHNPYSDNGIKLFGRDGYKLSDELEAKIEASLEKGPSHRAGPAELGRAKRLRRSRRRSLRFGKA